MIDRENEIFRVRSEIEENLKNCVRTFTIIGKGGIDPVEVMQDYLQRGSCYSFMMNKVNMTRFGFSSAVTFEANYSLGRYSLRNMLVKADEKVLEINRTLIRPEMSSLLKAFIVHSYLLDTVEYDHNSDETPLRSCYAHSAYGALIEKRSVCQGIANAFKLIMDKAGEKCYNVCGEARDNQMSSWGGHAWNMYSIREGVYAHIDVTFDIGMKEADRYMYFVKSSAQMHPDHRWKEELYPRAESGIDVRRELEMELSCKFRTFKESGVPEKYMRL